MPFNRLSTIEHLVIQEGVIFIRIFQLVCIFKTQSVSVFETKRIDALFSELHFYAWVKRYREMNQLFSGIPWPRMIRIAKWR